MGRRRPKRKLDGVLLLDKPQGMSSNAVLQAVKRLFNAQKAGHTGTLDPLATGLLPLCFGEATKFSQTLLEADKRYVAALVLGVRTDTGDAEGSVIQARAPAVTREKMQVVLDRFTGEIDQVPPMYSALKRHGRPLYELARQGVLVERLARRVRIHSLELRRWEGVKLEIEVHCSKGTYIRTLADDIGEALGCGAHVVGLRRIGIGAFVVDDAITPERMGELEPSEREACLLPVDALVQGLPRTDLEPCVAACFLHGQAVQAAAAASAGACRVYGDGLFLGLGQARPDGLFAPLRLVAAATDPAPGGREIP